MPLDLAADMHVFFADDEFGEAISVDGVGGFVGIWDRPTEDVALGAGMTIVDTNIMHLPRASVPDPTGRIIAIQRTGEVFIVSGVPRLNRDGTIWICELEAAH